MLGKLFVVSAPSGAGKTSLVTAVIEKLTTRYAIKRAVTYTTRAPRHNEVHGVDYYFITHKEFEQKVAQGFFIESSSAYGVYYGSSRSSIECIDQGEIIIIIVDIQGAFSIIQHIPQAIPIWIAPSDTTVLAQRLLNRSTETFDQITVRLLVGQRELEKELENSFFTYHIINDDFETALADFARVLQIELQK